MKSRSFVSSLVCSLAAVWLLAATSGRADAAISATGDVLPSYDGTDPWHIGSELTVGETAMGTLDISGGSIVTSTSAMLGDALTASGTVTVTGPDTIWNTTDGISIGGRGSGLLRITDGGRVFSQSGSLAGGDSTTTGRVVVSGDGSTWDVASTIGVGSGGVGQLDILAGGLVRSGKTIVGTPSTDSDTINFAGGTLNTRSLYASPSRLLGTGTVNTRGLLSDFDLTFDATTGLNQTVVLNSLPNQNVTLNVNALQTGPLLCYCDTMGAGYLGEGSLRIADGLDLLSRDGMLGYHSNSKGTATVTGAGTSWSSLSLYVGYLGQGELTIDDGAVVTTNEGVMGYFSAVAFNPVGTVTVEGPGSTWRNLETLRISSTGSTLNIFSGGLVTAYSSITLGSATDINMMTGGMLARRSAPGYTGSLQSFLRLISGSDSINYWDGVAWSSITNATFGVDYTLHYQVIDGGGYTVLTVGSFVQGDFDNDNDVDGADFLAWQRGESPNPLSAGDLADWQNNYGTGTLAGIGDDPARSVAVPEPSYLTLLFVVALVPARQIGFPLALE